jgi:hypothetical protein
MKQNNRFKQIHIRIVLTIATNTSKKRPRACARVAINTLTWSQINDSTEDTTHKHVCFAWNDLEKGCNDVTVCRVWRYGRSSMVRKSRKHDTVWVVAMCIYLWLEKQWKRVADELYVMWRTILKGLECDMWQSIVATRCRNFVNWSTFSALHLAANM